MTETDAAAPDPIDVHVGKLLRAYRQAADLPLDQLCELVSVSYQQINKYERAINRISASKLVEFARALGVSPSAFFEGLGGTDSAGQSGLVSDFFSKPEAVRLSIAFLRMNPLQQQAITQLAETMVDVSPQTGRDPAPVEAETGPTGIAPGDGSTLPNDRAGKPGPT